VTHGVIHWKASVNSQPKLSLFLEFPELLSFESSLKIKRTAQKAIAFQRHGMGSLAFLINQNLIKRNDNSMDYTTYSILPLAIMMLKFFKKTGFKQKYVFHEIEKESGEHPA